MALSRKHFEAIAGILAKNAGFYEGSREMYGLGKREALEDVTNDLADYFASENSSGTRIWSWVEVQEWLTHRNLNNPNGKENR